MAKRDEIIWESLKLFSTNGFDAVSTRMIARAVNASDAVIYKHFKSKQEILDTIIEVCKERFTVARQKADIETMDWSKVEDLCMDMFRFQIEDEWMVMFRRLLVIEQFKNKEMAELYQKFFIDIAIDAQTQIFTALMEMGYLKKRNPRILAMELYAPFFMYHTIRPDSEELLAELREHVTYFRENYKTELCDEV